MIPVDDSDARMLRRLSSYSAPAAQQEPKTANVTANVTPFDYSPGDWRKAEEASNAPYYSSITPNTTTIDTVPVKNLVAQNQPVPSVVYPTPITPSATPSTTVASIISKTSAPPIKTATPDIILFDDSSVPIEVMADLIFEDIGGQELINIARNDTINGQKIFYQPIKNIVSINQEYNPNNILGIQKTSDKYFSGFSIKLDEKVPNVGNSIDGNPAYMNTFGNIVIETINLNSDEQIEIQITLDGTIYEVNI